MLWDYTRYYGLAECIYMHEHGPNIRDIIAVTSGSL